MSEQTNSVGKTSAAGEQWAAGVAYTVLPSDIEREVYIRECYQNSRISIWSEDIGFINRVRVDEETLNFIEFPDTVEKLGTAIVFVTEPIHKQPIIVARLSKIDELGELRENLFKIKRKLGNKTVEISGSPEKGTLNLIVNAEDEKGVINILLSNNNSDGELNLSVCGGIKIDAAGNIEFLQKEKFYVKTVGKDGEDSSEASYEQTNKEHKLKGEKISINDGEEPMVLGNKIKSFIEDLIDNISAMTIVVTGTAGVFNPADITKLQAKKEELKSILSQEGFLNK